MEETPIIIEDRIVGRNSVGRNAGGNDDGGRRFEKSTKLTNDRKPKQQSGQMKFCGNLHNPQGGNHAPRYRGDKVRDTPEAIVIEER